METLSISKGTVLVLELRPSRRTGIGIVMGSAMSCATSTMSFA